MENKPQPSELDELGHIPWGSHFCLFYETREDLLEAVFPFFKQGLENHEYCLWVSARPEEALQSLRRASPEAETYLEKGEIEIVPHTQWYLLDHSFDAGRVLQAWVDKLEEALARGYAGLRCVGDTFWLEQHHWHSFAEYEAQLDAALSKLQIRVLCAYALERCSAETVLDVIEQHQFTLICRKGKCQRLERAELRRLKDEIRNMNAQLQQHLLSHHAEGPLTEAGASNELSAREQEVLRLITQGLTNREVAASLALSVRTVERFRSSLMKKLGLHGSTQLIIYAARHGLLDDGTSHSVE